MQQTDNLLVYCHLDISLGSVIVKQTVNEQQQRSTTLQNLLLTDGTPPPDDALPALELDLPPVLWSALDREVDSVGIDWEHVLHGRPASKRLKLSTAELVELCEVLSPGDWIMDPVGPRRVEVRRTGVSVAHYDEVRRVLGPATFLRRVKSPAGDRWG
jgi:hypothetical protein